MLPVTGNVNAMPRKLSCKLEIGNNTITEVKQLTYAQDWSGDISIGQVVSSYITATIPTPSFSLTGANVSHSMGIGSPAEWVAVGTYRVDASSVRTRQGYTSFNAYDKLHDSVNSYVPNSNYAETLQGLCDDVCNQIGITSASLGVSLSLNKADLAGYTLRDVLGFITAYCGKNAYLNASGGLVLKYFSNASYTADGTRANVPYIGENNCTVGRLICQSADGVLTAGSGEGIYFTCPFMTQARLSSLQSALGLTYRKADVDIPYGNFCLQSGDIITVTTTGSNLTVPIMANSFTYDGGLSSSVSAYGVSDYSGSANNAEQSISARRYQSVLNNKAAEQREHTYIENELQTATDKITGASGGYIRITFGNDGKTAQLLITDAPTVEASTNMWVFNQVGLGHMGRSSTSDPWSSNIALIEEGTLVAERIAGTKISGVGFESLPVYAAGRNPQIMIEDGVINFKDVQYNSGQITSVSDVGSIKFKSRSGLNEPDSLALTVPTNSGNCITMGEENNAEFRYYTDVSQAPSGAEKFNFDGNIRFYSSVTGRVGYYDLAALEKRIYDLENP